MERWVEPPYWTHPSIHWIPVISKDENLISSLRISIINLVKITERGSAQVWFKNAGILPVNLQTNQ